MTDFTVATYNVNSIRSRLHIVIPWLEKHRPLALCMQETKVDDPEFPVKDFTAIGYHVTFRGAKRYNGVAIASLIEPKEVSFGLDDGDPADEDRLIRAIFDDLTVVNCYVPQGRDKEHEQFQYKLQWLERLERFFAARHSAGENILCCGDLNVAREEIDVHDPKRLLGHVDFTPEVWEGFDRLISWGFADVFRRHHPDEPNQYTFFDYRVPRSVDRGLGWRIDHILATPSLAERSTDCFIDLEPRRAEKPSDHTILAAVFKKEH